MYAIVRTGGKQYKVSEGTIFKVEKLEAEEGDIVELDEVLLVADGERVHVGSPRVPGAKVTATVLQTAKGRKIKGYTYKKVKNVQRHYGHRQWYTQLRIEKIEAKA